MNPNKRILGKDLIYSVKRGVVVSKLSKEELKKIKEIEFVEENLTEISELLILKDNVKKAELEYKKARKSLLKKMESKGLSLVHVPKLRIRLQICGGRFTAKLDTKKLKNKYPAIYEEFKSFNMSDSYIMIFSEKKRRKRNNVK